MPLTSAHAPQIERIKGKLKKARLADPNFKVFGASSHRYDIGEPLSAEAIEAFEATSNIHLPSDYASFLMHIGNGGLKDGAPAAGPFYGLFPLNERRMAASDAAVLSAPASLSPAMTEAEWSRLSAKLNSDDDISDAEYDQIWQQINGGMLPLGDQGCGMEHALVLNGPYAGRVVNLNPDGYQPQFAFEHTFLDWYERWLDEVIGGILFENSRYAFGYSMGGDDTQLMDVVSKSDDPQHSANALIGLLKLHHVTTRSCRQLDRLCQDRDVAIRTAAVTALAKFDISRAIPHLQNSVRGDDAECLSACDAVLTYTEASCTAIAPDLMKRLPTLQNFEACRNALLVLNKANAAYGDVLRPFLSHPHEDMRKLAVYYLGRLANKSDHLDAFVTALGDTSSAVVVTALQALHDIPDEQLLPAYAEVASRYSTGPRQIRIALMHRLREFGYDSIDAFERDNQLGIASVNHRR